MTAITVRHVPEDVRPPTPAHQDLLDLRVSLWPCASTAPRVWELRSSVTAYDAASVAVAEALEVALLTLDGRLAEASGPRRGFLVVPS